MTPYLHLPGIADVAAAQVRRQVEQNVLEYLKWAFLEAGGYSEVPVVTPGTPDGSSFYMVQQDGVTNGTTWQSQHPNWCHETGLETATPTVCAGIYINGVYHATATASGLFAHALDFVGGRVTFQTPQASTAVIQAAYSYRRPAFYDGSIPWFRDVVLDSFLTDQAGQGGVVAVLDRYRVSTPFVVVESAMRQDLKARQVGSLSHWVGQDVLCYVVAQTKQERDGIADALSNLANFTFLTFDVNQRRNAAAFPLDWKGSPVPGAPQYPQLLATYPWKIAYVRSTNGSEVAGSPPLFRGVVRLTVEVAA